MPIQPEAQYQVDAQKLNLLSEREATLLAMASQGLLDREIAAQLGLSPNTLRTYWSRIRAKLGDGSRIALTGAYLEHRIKSGIPLVGGEPASWEVDLEAWTVRLFDPHLSGLMGVELLAPIDAELLLAQFHHEDQPKIRALLESAREGNLPSFAYRARMVTRQGLTMAGAYVEVVRDRDGKVVLLRGRRIPIMDISQSSLGDLAVGHYVRNLRSGDVWVDEGCRAIYGVSDTETNIRDAILRRYHPDDVEQAGTFIDDMLEQGLRTMTRSYRLVDDERRYHWVSAQTQIIYDEEGPATAKITVMAYK